MRRLSALLTALLLVLAAPATVAGATVGGGAPAAAGGAPATAASSTPAVNATQEANATTVTLLTYNDIQTAAAEDGNFSRLVTLIEQRRAAHDNPVVVAGAGDQIGPHALGPVSQWRAPVDVLNEVDPAADVIGNHEFDYGYAEISNVTNASEFPWLATNLVNNGTGEAFDGTEDHVIVEKQGIRVGFIGLIDEGATYGKTNIDFAARNNTVRNVSVAGPEAAERLKSEEDVDVVVALAHTGVPDAKEIARADDGAIDVIATGDDEIYYPPQETSDTVIVEGEARARYLSELNLTVADGDVTAVDGRLINVTSEIPKDETASGIITDYRNEVSLDSTVAETETALDARFATNYHRESNYGNLVTDAMRAETGAQVAITNAGGIRSNSVYGPGNLTGGDVFNTLPFANTLVTVELTGAELERTLESQIVTLESETGGQFGEEISQQTAGADFEWDGTDGADVHDLSVNGEPVAADETYTVAVNSYIAAGGSGYPLENATRVSTSDTLLATALVDYLESEETVAPTVEGRMRRVDVDLPRRVMWVDGKADTTFRYALPRTATGVDRDSVFIEDDEGDRVNATSVTRNGNTVVASFDDSALATLADGQGGEAADLYMGYTDSRYNDRRSYWANTAAAGDAVLLISSEAAAGADNEGTGEA